jgi:hypothetical protein
LPLLQLAILKTVERKETSRPSVRRVTLLFAQI